MAATIECDAIRQLDPETFASIRSDYETDGAAIIRGLIPQSWLDQLAEGTERLMNEREDFAEIAGAGGGRFYNGLFGYLRAEEYRNFIWNSGIGAIVADIMGSATSRFFYDQPLVKEPGTPKRTPWHHDSAYWPCSGWQVMSVWIPLDPATPQNGVVTYVKGSHKWNAFYPMENWSEQVVMNDASRSNDVSIAENPGPGASPQQLRTIADINRHPENYDLTTWEVEPGDVLIHHMHTVHGAPGNLTQSSRRRAIAFRFLGDDARWDDTRPHFIRKVKQSSPDFPYPQLNTGDPMDDPLFPLIWPAKTS